MVSELDIKAFDTSTKVGGDIIGRHEAAQGEQEKKEIDENLDRYVAAVREQLDERSHDGTPVQYVPIDSRILGEIATAKSVDVSTPEKFEDARKAFHAQSPEQQRDDIEAAHALASIEHVGRTGLKPITYTERAESDRETVEKTR